ncbi:MAG: hypothetical protein FJ399_15375, partial [Verrucomicrobia bacterium]|nr:hypothetical protein [Verrucomicrobiota bacterium]
MRSPGTDPSSSGHGRRWRTRWEYCRLGTAIVLLAGPGSTLAAPPYRARVEVEASVSRTIHSGGFSLSVLDRQRYFRSYHPLGAFSESRNRELDEIGALPARGTFSLSLAVDSKHPDRPTADSLALALRQHREAYQRAQRDHPGVPHANAHGRYPLWMRARPAKAPPGTTAEDWELAAGENILAASWFEPYASYVSQWYEGIKRAGGYPPTYLTAQNEPSAHWKVDDYAAYSRLLADRMHRDHPEETALIKLTLDGVPGDREAVHEYWAYARPTVVSVRPGVAHEFSLEAPTVPGHPRAAWLEIGLARDGGFDTPASVTANGVPLPPLDLNASRGIKDYHALAQVAVPLV